MNKFPPKKVSKTSFGKSSSREDGFRRGFAKRSENKTPRDSKSTMMNNKNSHNRSSLSLWDTETRHEQRPALRGSLSRVSNGRTLNRKSSDQSSLDQNDREQFENVRRANNGEFKENRGNSRNSSSRNSWQKDGWSRKLLHSSTKDEQNLRQEFTSNRFKKDENFNYQETNFRKNIGNAKSSPESRSKNDSMRNFDNHSKIRRFKSDSRGLAKAKDRTDYHDYLESERSEKSGRFSRFKKNENRNYSKEPIDNAINSTKNTTKNNNYRSTDDHYSSRNSQGSEDSSFKKISHKNPRKTQGNFSYPFKENIKKKFKKD